MRTWPALDVGATSPGLIADQASRPVSVFDLFQAALTDYDVAAIDEQAADRWRVFFHTAADRDRAALALASDFPALRIDTLDEPDEDWAARSQANLRAVRVGDVIVAPPWDVPDITSGLAVTIQPSMGFGTGHHATTRLCLAALQAAKLEGRSCLDVGTGSGVLAIVANLLGASPVVAVDDDADAIASAQENLALNPMARVDLRTIDLRTLTTTPYDVVVANLTGGLLIQAAETLAALCAHDGALVLSGLMDHEEAGVLAAFPTMRVRRRSQEDEWMCVVLGREGADR